MGSSVAAFALIWAIGGLGQSPGAIQQEEVDYQSQVFQRRWGTDFVWKYEELPSAGSVPAPRMPYSGHIYPDRAGGTIRAMEKYDRAFHGGRNLCSAYELEDTARTKTQWVRRGLLGLRRAKVDHTPGWYGHCNGWTAAAIRHAEPQRSVVRAGVVFTPADIKGLLAELYMYADAEFLGGDETVINPGTFHAVLGNWLGRGSYPIAMEAAVGDEVWNFPVYAYASSFARRSDTEVEVKVNLGYVRYTEGEPDRAPRNTAVKYFHYLLELDGDGEIVGGRYFRDSSQVDMLWTPLQPLPGGSEGNERGNPHLDVKQLLSIWRESVPEEVRRTWLNIDPTEEDRILEDEDEPSDESVARVDLAD